MAFNFGVENSDYKRALDEIRIIKLPESHWKEVVSMIENENIKAIQVAKRQQVDNELMHRCFTI